MFKHCIISFDWFPKFGGAHYWLHEVYKRWPEPITVITTDVRKEFGEEQDRYDRLDHGAISKIIRLPIKVRSWGVDYNFLKNSLLISNAIREHGGGAPVVVHSVKGIPETLSLVFLKIFLGKRLKVITYAHGEEFLVAGTSRQLKVLIKLALGYSCLLYTSPSPRDLSTSRMPSSA